MRRLGLAVLMLVVMATAGACLPVPCSGDVGLHPNCGVPSTGDIDPNAGWDLVIEPGGPLRLDRDGTATAEVYVRHPAALDGHIVDLHVYGPHGVWAGFNWSPLVLPQNHTTLTFQAAPGGSPGLYRFEVIADLSLLPGQPKQRKTAEVLVDYQRWWD